ncbi:MAG TPA: LexA family transcriptional regulator [Flavobacteriaceae bacterium]|nr:LexA family transcriptional regulator [Flavobacteriaceae bacterium]
MEVKTEICKRIKKLRKEKGISQAVIAEKLGISQAAYSLIENSQNGILIEHIVNLSKLYGVTTDFILTGNELLTETTPENGFVPFINLSAHAGFIKNFHEDHVYEEYDWYRIPGVNPTLDQKLFEVEGDSMSPTLLSGDIVICQPQLKIEHIIDGSVVLVVTMDDIAIKRYRKDEDSLHVQLESDNPKVETYRVKKSEILQMMTVQGKISGVLVPHHQIVSRGKIQRMDEDIESLKKELFLLEKKMQGKKK